MSDYDDELVKMRQSLERMYEGGPYEPPSPMFPLHDGCEAVRDAALHGEVNDNLLRWFAAASDILQQPAPRPDVCPCGCRGEGTTHGGSSCTSSAVVERKLRP